MSANKPKRQSWTVPKLRQIDLILEQVEASLGGGSDGEITLEAS